MTILMVGVIAALPKPATDIDAPAVEGVSASLSIDGDDRVAPPKPFRIEHRIWSGDGVSEDTQDGTVLAGGPAASPRMHPPAPKAKSAQPGTVRMASLRVRPHEQTTRAHVDGRLSIPDISLPAPKPTHPDIDTDGVFGRVSLAFSDPSRISGWRNVHQAYGRDLAILSNCVSGACPGNASLANHANRLRELKGKAGLAKLDAVNRLANAVPYRPDRGDVWSAPSAILTGGGDCEDVALLKMASLGALGVPNSAMAIAVGHISDGRPHAVLTVQLDGRTFVLDNRSDQILTDNQSDFIPRYSVSTTRRWTHVERRYAHLNASVSLPNNL